MPAPTEVTVDPATNSCSPATVPATGRPAKLKFKLKDPSQWQWYGTSPVVVQDGVAQFPTPSSIHPSSGAVHLDDNNTDTNAYKYSVTATHKHSGQQVNIDPIIQNGADK